jgi:hypothetical protein
MPHKASPELPGIVSYQEYQGMLIGITLDHKLIELAMIMPTMESIVVPEPVKNKPGPKVGSHKKKTQPAPASVPPAPVMAEVEVNGMDPVPTPGAE